MAILASVFVFLLGILAWVPALRNNGHYEKDVAGAMYWVARMKKGDSPFYKEHFGLPVGHLFHLHLMQSFWDKDNTRAFYGIMAVYNSLTAVLLFWVVQLISGPLPAFLGSLVFCLYIVNPRIAGNWGMFEQLLGLPLMAALLCLLPPSLAQSHLFTFLGGMFFGYAILVKQLAVLYWPGYALVLLGAGHPGVHQVIFSAGILFVQLIPLLYYWIKHRIFWGYLVGMWLYLLPSAVNPGKYNRYYPEVFVTSHNRRYPKSQVLLKNSRNLPLPLFLSCSAVLFLVLSGTFSWVHAGLLFCLACSVYMVFLRGTLFSHYWLNMIPWLAIFSGTGLGGILFDTVRPGDFRTSTAAALLAVGLLAADTVRADRGLYVFSRGEDEFLRKVHGEKLAQRYTLWKKIGKYIKNHTDPDSRILVCGWTPHILLYSDRAHFTPSPCMMTEDYFNIYSRENPSMYGFLNEIYRFKHFKLIRPGENPFRTGYPEIIVFGDGKKDIAGFEKLTGMKYVLDDKVDGCPLYRVDVELSGWMSLLETPGRDSIADPLFLETQHRQFHEAMEAQDWSRVLSHTAKLMQSRPYDPLHLRALADALFQLGKFELFLELSSRLLNSERVPDTVKEEILNKLGEAYCHLGCFDQAENVFRTLLGINNTNTAAMNNLGFVFFRQDRIEEAAGCFREVLHLEPGNEDAVYNLRQLGITA